MPDDVDNLDELLRRHFSERGFASVDDSTSSAWLTWQLRTAALTIPPSWLRAESSADVADAEADFQALLSLAKSHEAIGELELAQELFEFVRSSAAQQLGPQHRITEDAVVGLIRVCRRWGNADEAEQIERPYFSSIMQEVVDLGEDALVDLAYSAIDAAGYSAGLAAAGPAERLRRFLAETLWANLKPDADQFDQEVHALWQKMSPSLTADATNAEKVTYAAAASLVLQGWAGRLMPQLDATDWSVRDWSGVTLALLHFRDSQPSQS